LAGPSPVNLCAVFAPHRRHPLTVPSRDHTDVLKTSKILSRKKVRKSFKQSFWTQPPHPSPTRWNLAIWVEKWLKMLPWVPSPTYEGQHPLLYNGVYHHTSCTLLVGVRMKPRALHSPPALNMYAYIYVYTYELPNNKLRSFVLETLLTNTRSRPQQQLHPQHLLVTSCTYCSITKSIPLSGGQEKLFPSPKLTTLLQPSTHTLSLIDLGSEKQYPKGCSFYLEKFRPPAPPHHHHTHSQPDLTYLLLAPGPSF
jgi:hypothetical protein